jgi:hypothetical protein
MIEMSVFDSMRCWDTVTIVRQVKSRPWLIQVLARHSVSTQSPVETRSAASTLLITLFLPSRHSDVSDVDLYGNDVAAEKMQCERTGLPQPLKWDASGTEPPRHSCIVTTVTSPQCFTVHHQIY